MNIKLNTPKTRTGKHKYLQGSYNVVNKDKYMGDLSKVIYRSSWELLFMQYLDNNTSIKRWSSEHIVITYPDKHGKLHRYYPDFYAEIIKSDPNNFKAVVIELKPYAETQKPVAPKKNSVRALESFEYRLKTFEKNVYKWSKAVEWCKQRQMEFVIIHEGHLKEKNILRS